jgi:hypothetical protein
VAINKQTSYVEKMRRQGRQVPQFLVQAIDDDHHGTVEYSRLVAAGCVLGRSDAEIARAVETVTRRNADVNERKRREQVAKATMGIATQHPVSTLRSAVTGVNGG